MVAALISMLLVTRICNGQSSQTRSYATCNAHAAYKLVTKSAAFSWIRVFADRGLKLRCPRGSAEYSTLNGLNPAWLWANFTWLNFMSQPLGWSLTRQRNKSPTERLTTSVCLSFGGWETVYSVGDDRRRQAMGMVDIWKDIWATLTTSVVFLERMKCTIFEKWSTTTKLESLPCCIRGRQNTKSILISIHGCKGTSGGI